MTSIEQLYTGCLAEAAYYIESNGEVAIIDPLREVQAYIDKAARNNAKIKYVFETHFHADFVSGHIDLAKKTGAEIIFGPTTMDTGYEMLVAEDGQEFQLGDIKLKVLHTPGHTMESSCFLLIDEEGKEKALFTGDTLFIGDVGRPDLAQKVIAELTQDKLAGYLFDSLRNKIMPLADDIIIYPAHGAGSACGKNMSSETFDTLGNQKKTNYALRADMTKAEFKKELLTGLMPPPGYFPQNVLMNIKGYDSIDTVLNRGVKALSAREFKMLSEEPGIVTIDTRNKDAFVNEFIPNSTFIGLDGSFASWVGTLYPDVNQKFIFIAEEGKEAEVVTRMARVGHDQPLGYLKGGISAWKKAGYTTDSMQSINVAAFAKRKNEGQILDIRKASEYNSEHILNAINTPLDYIDQSIANVERDKTYFVHCASGYRSVIFISILKAKGYDKLINIEGGIKEIKENGEFDVSDYVCPTTML
jgi:glyoxylase-like metal-dependent hydrolase (beta-lactamase superfamily II)/rhodanese-related sulfurtransferase